ncbi:uncharacterized protein LOC114916845 [Cajanus cajan]|uniref:Uncharacterized protein n=1 Tax=Cajanus cajan TaxID=3821 RepID=A0A151S417_CAJCA|nr:uncharacterized protein LOC114916845 [Cajanus cajan]KYP49497.1 hypothetical protein KK1_028778 [Cajanus cajan]
MGTSLLCSHDCLQGDDAMPFYSSSIRSQRNPNPSPNPSHARRRKVYDGDHSGMVVKGLGGNLVMGQVKILKRGEKLSPGVNLTLCNPNLLLSIHYESLRIALWFDHRAISSALIEPLSFSTGPEIDTTLRKIGQSNLKSTLHTRES